MKEKAIENITAEVICDSVNVCGNRLTTFVLQFPRFVLAEFNTHRMLSRNAASSRAIKIEKMIETVRNNPALPVFWGKNQKGMQSEEELEGEQLLAAQQNWLRAVESAIESARILNESGLHKQYVNRVIENFMYVKVIASATDLHNFFALRAHKDAQPEIRVLAEKMLEQYNTSNPKFLKPGEWHLPFSAGFDQQRVQKESSIWGESREEIIKQICTARVARVSYLNFEGKDDYSADIKLCKRLFKNVPKHSSPAESVAVALAEPTRIGNFIGFKQYRKFFKNENIERDLRVKVI